MGKDCVGRRYATDQSPQNPIISADILAHIIREPSKSFAKSVCGLQADRRWAVTGTPIQNRLVDMFSLFKFLRCSPFDDMKVFNAQVIQNWKLRSDPDSVAKLKLLVNCLSLRRPKTTIKLLPRTDETVYLDFNQLEWDNYQRTKAMTLKRIEFIDEVNKGSIFLNALKWVNELRLICNHGLRESRQASTLENSWNARESQARFDQLEQVGLARCSNTECGQDLSSVIASDGDLKHDDEPWISESLELWCSSCFAELTRKPFEVYKICNHASRQTTKPSTSSDQDFSYLESNSTTPSRKDVPTDSVPLPTKIKRLLQDLLETSEDQKRYSSRLHSPAAILTNHLLQCSLLFLDQNLRHHSASTVCQLCSMRSSRWLAVYLRSSECSPRIPQ